MVKKINQPEPTLAMFFVLQLLSTAFSPLSSVEFRLTYYQHDYDSDDNLDGLFFNEFRW